MKMPRQCAILVGGLGTRLGALTAETPKPLLECGGRPFLAWVLRELSRFGIEEIVLLAGYKSEAIERFVRTVGASLPKPVAVKVSAEPRRADTGGAIWWARDLLDESFLLVNGDSWFDTNLVRFFAGAAAGSRVHMLLHRVDDASRYGVVELRGRTVAEFREKPAAGRPGLINAGICLLDRSVVEQLAPESSFEREVLPRLAGLGLVSGVVAEGFFIDIGTPADYTRARTELPDRLLRPALFLDRDGVLNEDLGWVVSKEQFRWIEGAKAAVRVANDAGMHVFVVTNQAGVAKGLYTEREVRELHEAIGQELRSGGAFIDDFRFCPFHPEAVVDRYRQASDWRKPGPGMIVDLVEKWEVRTDRSLLIGDQEKDLLAAAAAGIAGHRFSGGDLRAFVEDRLASGRTGAGSAAGRGRVSGGPPAADPASGGI